jgi:FKBP-type peptidyl-prolyl cis-trans isomerase FklB
MKYLSIALLCVAFLACQGITQNKAQIKTNKDSVSYSIGMNIGHNLKMQSIDVDPMIVGQGIKDILDSAKTAMTDSQAQICMMNFQKQMMAQQEIKMKAEGEKAKKEGEAFLAENKTKPGVVTLPDGLQYKVEKMGTGVKPKDTSTVKVNYAGRLITGVEFESSYKSGQPVEFALNQVIRGWSEVLQLMPVGSKWTVYLPSDLAYGERGRGQTIPPNSALVFDIELLASSNQK